MHRITLSYDDRNIIADSSSEVLRDNVRAWLDDNSIICIFSYTEFTVDWSIFARWHIDFDSDEDVLLFKMTWL